MGGLKPSVSVTERVSGEGTAWRRPTPLVDVVNLPDFPIETAFPYSLHHLRDYIAAAAESYQVNLGTVAMTVLPYAAIAAARQIEVVGAADWHEPTAIWTLVPSESGERKSAIHSEVGRPLHEWMREKSKAMSQRIAEFENELTVLELRWKRAQQQAINGGDAEVRRAASLAAEVARLREDRPRPPAFVTAETTSEALSGILARNSERALVASTEGGVLGTIMGRYASGQPNLDVWLCGHAGDAYTSSRRGREDDHLERPYLCVALCTQREAVRDILTSEHAAGVGFTARFLPWIPRSLVGFRNLSPAPIPQQLRDYWRDTLHDVLDHGSPPEPRAVSLSPAGAAAFEHFHQSVERSLRPYGELGDHRAWGSKLAGAALRIAGVLHVLEGGNSEIREDTLLAALSWVDAVREHQKALMAEMGVDPTTAVALRIVRWMRQKRLTRFRKRDAQQALKSAHLRAEDLDEPLALMAEYHWLRETSLPQEAPRRGRRPSPLYEVNPLDPSCSGGNGGNGGRVP